MTKKHNQVRNITFIIIICTVLSKMIGAFRDLVLSYYYGSSSISDAYILATTIPVTIFAFIYEGIGASFMPVCARLKSKDDENKLTSNLINLLFILTFILVIFIEIFPELTIKVFASGFAGNTLKNAVFLTRISILGVFFSSAVYVLISYLNYNDSFVAPALRAVPMDIVVIVSIVVSAYTKSLIPMAIGIPISLFIELLFLIPTLIKKGFKFSFMLNIKDENIKNVIVWALPIVISTAVADLNSIIDRQFSSWLLDGGISALTYSSRTLNMVRTTFFIPVITVLFPIFTRYFKNGKINDASLMTSKCLSILFLLATPLTFGIMAFSKDIITILFQRGAFDLFATEITANCFKYYSIALIGYAVIVVTSKVFYAMTDMKTPMLISIIGMFLNVVFNFIFSRQIGLSGLAIATSISTLFMAGLHYYVLNKKMHFDNYNLLCTIVKSLFSSIVMIITIIPLRYNICMNLPLILNFLICVFVGILVYFLMLLLLKVDDLKYLLNLNNRRKNEKS